MFSIKLVYHLHGKGIKEKAKNGFLKILYRIAFRKADIICLSPLLVNDIEDVFKGNVHIVSNGIADNSDRNSRAPDKELINKKFSILFLSNLLISKGILDFLEALKILSNKELDFEAIIVGAEGDLNSIDLNEKLVEFKLKGKVVYMGPKYGSDKEEIFLLSDVLVFPTRSDVFGIVILEAMQYGLPVIATHEGAIPEIVENGITGYIVEKQNPEQICEKLELFIKDTSLGKRMGASGRNKFLEKYTLEKYESNLKQVFTEVLN